MREIPNAVWAHPYTLWGPIVPPPPRITTYAVSATNLHTFAARIGALRSYCPVERIGATTLVYRFEEPPADVRGLAEPHPTSGLSR